MYSSSSLLWHRLLSWHAVNKSRTTWFCSTISLILRTSVVMPWIKPSIEFMSLRSAYWFVIMWSWNSIQGNSIQGTRLSWLPSGSSSHPSPFCRIYTVHPITHTRTMFLIICTGIEKNKVSNVRIKVRILTSLFWQLSIAEQYLCKPKAIRTLFNQSKKYCPDRQHVIYSKHNWDLPVFQSPTHWTKPASWFSLNEAMKWFKHHQSHDLRQASSSASEKKKPYWVLGHGSRPCVRGTTTILGSRSETLKKSLPKPLTSILYAKLIWHTATPSQS